MDFVFTALLWMVGGFVYCNALEWIVHKYVLHGLGKKKNSFWSFHWRGHHKESRRNNFKDSRWDNIPLHKDKEFLGILFLAVMHAATLWISPVLYGTIVWRGPQEITRRRRLGQTKCSVALGSSHGPR